MEDTFSYEEYQEAVLMIISDAAMSEQAVEAELAELAADYPDYTARQEAEAAARRAASAPSEEPEARQEQEKVIFLEGPYKVGDIIRDGSEQYRVTHDSFFVSAEELVEEAEDETGWHTRAMHIGA